MKNTIVASIALAWFCIPAWGQQANTDLAAQNAVLEQKVRDLEDRLIALEGKVRMLQTTATPPAQSAAEGQPAAASSANAAAPAQGEAQPQVVPSTTSPIQGQ